MNIKYHLAIGLLMDLSLGTPLYCTAGSIAPDFPLIGNEIKLWKTKRKFSAEDVPVDTVNLYHLTHSILVLPLIFMCGKYIFAAYLFHQICDWFTHTGRFATKPFYPISNWQIPFGRNILK